MIYAFDGFELDTRRMELRQNGEATHLEPKHFELLSLLVAHADRVLTKDEIFDEIWPGVFVTEASLSGAIKHIRKALGDDGATQTFIRTVRGKGFRFVRDLERGQTALSDSQTIENEHSNAMAGQPVIAVLPFSLIGSDREETAIADGLPIEIIAGLSRLHSISVIARGSSFRLDLQAHALSDIHARLGVTYVVSGSIEVSGQRVRIVVDLADTRDEQVLWSETYDVSLDDIFIVRQDVVRAVATAVDLRIPQHEAVRLTNVPTEKLDAWGLYHLGLRHLYRFSGPENTKAAAYFKLALERDPDFGRATAGLSYTEFENFNLGFGPEKSAHLANALAHAERSVDLDPHDPFCNLVLGRAHWIHQDIDGAQAWTDRAINLNPNYAFGHYNSGKFSAIACHGTAADQHLQSALTFSPIDPHLQSMLSARAFAAFVDDQPEQAIRFAEQSLRAPNAHLYVCVIAAAIFAHFGRDDRSDDVLARIAKLGGGFGRDHFEMLFRPTDPAKAAQLQTAFDRLGF
ncbi:winged helix-turn-helix domain-containing protein [Cognatiyoonia sp. IB215446]|uniref:winged helix-turn-helix domain-containing tetratricopeptide repeat protein n=1 Tax=Cognatiyoonia sp. IB215446 TaxID=3097355 RepID=UPI002A0E4EE1|nr:winged helix-turn-helix domain-containing protein [Cognatiyoonia sp. IB215446]MDX8346955.1 winged helix-turn-helix domain-containing protein [Cognatiyoonia sp. IB215446]